MSLSNDKKYIRTAAVNFLDDLAASERRNISDVIFSANPRCYHQR